MKTLDEIADSIILDRDGQLGSRGHIARGDTERGFVVVTNSGDDTVTILKDRRP